MVHRLDPGARKNRHKRRRAAARTIAALGRSAGPQRTRSGAGGGIMAGPAVPVLLLSALVGLALGSIDPHAASAEQVPVGAERIEARFTRCGGFGATYCVVDGDTIRLGKRRIRLVGFDAPEVHARCAAEAEGAERATQALQSWLNRGPFDLVVAPHTSLTDRYGRDLRAVLRESGDGTEALSGYMVRRGYARVYDGGRRAGWCGKR